MAEEFHTDYIPLVEERVSVDKVKRLGDRVRVSTHTETVESRLPVELAEMEVEVVRVPVGRKIDMAPQVVTEGDLTIIPVVEERIVVTRELYLVEEVHIRRTERRETTEIPVATRRQTVDVQRISPAETDQHKGYHDDL